MRVQITVLKSDTGFHLYAIGGYCGIMKAGPRLLRLNPPDIKFQHTDEAAANKDAAKLQQHVDNWERDQKNKRHKRIKTAD